MSDSFSLRKYMTEFAAVSGYKQAILPLLDFAGFLWFSCTKDERYDFAGVSKYCPKNLHWI